MKTLLVTINNPANGDLVIIEYLDKTAGGCTSAKTVVVGERVRPILDGDGYVTGTEPVPAQTSRDVAKVLGDLIRKDWISEAFQARVNEETGSLVIHCTDLVADKVVFRASVAGTGGTTLDLLEF